jgi:AcrR family transcriptional regulator
MNEDPSPTRVLRGRHRIAAGDSTSVARDTRARIQEVALELFISEGYDKTSLREIAERLGVTKAALYYHFPTKDDIINSLIEDRIERIEELISWAGSQPRTLETKRELLRRYSEDLRRGRHHEVMQFFERNQPAIKAMPSGARMRELMRQMVEHLSDPTDPLDQQIKSSMALFAIHATWFIFRDPTISDDEKRDAALRVAFELIG